VLFPLLALGLSAAWWLPFAWSLTRTVSTITATTERIADGRFDARVPVRRRDELGHLADAVNRMAARLEGHLAAQKQFLADVAHEVASPLARLRMALGLLQSQPAAGPPERTLADMQDDLQQMADMLDDLLLYTRSDPAAPREPPQAVDVRAIAAAAVEREGGAGRVTLDIDPALRALARPPMLARALANLVRNALRYAAAGGPIEIVARRQGDRVVIHVCDRGPGVPEHALARLGEPLFRLDESRSREEGGFGLGLAIVRRCVAACEGEVDFRNREGGGFEAVIRLPAAP
jgi:two-component system sensor histidine kinase CpxA